MSKADRGNVYLFIDRNQMEDFSSGKEGEDLEVGPWLTEVPERYNNIVYSSTF